MSSDEDAESDRLKGNSWKPIRREVLQRDGFVCQGCGDLVGAADDPQPTAHVHHKTSLSEGGSNDLDNLTTLCPSCHDEKHDGPVGRAAEDTSVYGKSLNDHPNWKGGRTVTSHGYVMLKAPNHPDAHTNGYIYEHRLVAERMLGRRLESEEHVHHKNGDKQDNRPENLEVHDETEHRVQHRDSNSDRRLPGEPNPVIECACGCGQTFKKYDEYDRPRERVPGHTEYSQATPAKDDIMETLRSRGPVHRQELAVRVDRSLNAVSSHLSELRNDGRAEPVGNGDWDTTESSDEVGDA